jgi:hypothetical protein
MKFKKVIRKIAMAGAGLLSLMQTSAGDFEVIPDEGIFNSAEKKRAEDLVRYTYKTGSIIVGPGCRGNRTFPVSIFGRYGLSARHCFVYSPKSINLSEPVEKRRAEATKINVLCTRLQSSDTWAIRAGGNNTNDWYIIKTDKQIRNTRPLYTGTKRLLNEGRKVSWAGLWGVSEDSVNATIHIYGPINRKNPTLTYYSSKIICDKPLSGEDFTYNDSVTGEPMCAGYRWVTEAKPIDGVSGSVIYAEGEGRGRKWDIPIGVINSGIYFAGKGRTAFVHIDELIEEIKKYEKKTGEKNVSILPLPDWIK